MNRNVFANAGKVRTTVIMFAASLFVASGAFAQITDVASLEAAIAAGNPGDTFNLAAGTYAITQPIVLKDNQTFIGAGAATTIIDGGGDKRIFEAVDFIGQTGWVIDGLTLTNGRATLASLVDDSGGVIILRSGATGTMSNCTCTNSSADDDAGFASIAAAALTVTNCVITSCFTTPGGDGFGDDGGAIKMDGNGTLIMEGCRITGCTANDSGAAIKVGSSNNTTTRLRNCVFFDNGAADNENLLEIRNDGQVLNCTIVGNTLSNGPLIELRSPDLGPNFGKLLNCIIADNTISDDMDTNGLVEVRPGEFTIPSASQNLFFNNTNAGTGGFGSLTVPSVDNIVGDPLFVSATDFHLLPGSAAIDAGTDTSADGVTTDFDGLSRPVGIAYDIGAYELLAGPPPEVTNVGDWALYN